MANTTYVEGNRRTFIASADYSSTGQFLLVKMHSVAGQIVLASSAADPIIGVLMNAPKSGDVADVYLLNSAGTCKAYVGPDAGVTYGDWLTADEDGGLITSTADEDRVVGQALFTAAAGDIVEFMPANFELS